MTLCILLAFVFLQRLVWPYRKKLESSLAQDPRLPPVVQLPLRVGLQGV